MYWPPRKAIPENEPGTGFECAVKLLLSPAPLVLVERSQGELVFLALGL
jgi:hypothetical protein